MLNSPICTSARTKLEEVRRLKVEFERAYTLAEDSNAPDDAIKAREIKVVLEEKIGELDKEIRKERVKFFDKRIIWFLEKLLAAGTDKTLVAASLIGLDSDRAWAMREKFLTMGR